jgi:Flp pilus assembly protein TadD
LAVTLPNAPPEAWRAHGYALVSAGRRDEGRAALARYLQLAPSAPDAAMVRYSLQQ